MDELEISGKRFISSKRAAKENRYHMDYIGQLIRSGKVVGSKVGRTWYVDAQSLATYLGKEYKAPEKAATPYTPASKASTPAPKSTPHTYTTYAEPIQEAPKLTYITEDEPIAAPQAHHIQKVEVHIPEKKAVTEEKNAWDALDHPLISPALPTKKPQWELVAAVGVVAFLGALGASALFSYTNLIAGSENTASVTFTGIPAK